MPRTIRHFSLFLRPRVQSACQPYWPCSEPIMGTHCICPWSLSSGDCPRNVWNFAVVSHLISWLLFSSPSIWLKIFKSNHIILSLENRQWLASADAHAVSRCNLTGPDSLPGSRPVPCLFLPLSALPSFFVLESVKLIPTLRALHLLFLPSGTWLLSLCMEEPVLMSPAQRSDLWPSGIKSFPAFPSSYSLLFYPALFISA